jgi:hypothetical protein
MSITLRAEADGPEPFPPLDGLLMIIFAGATDREVDNLLLDGFAMVCFGISLIYRC